MAIYKMVGDKDRLEKVTSTSFGKEGVLERADLQRILRDQPEVLEEGLLIISEEFGNWQDSNRRIDLLGLDSAGRLVVVELKRGDTGNHMDLQAIRYAAMVANMTLEQVVDAHQAYLDKRARDEGKAVEEDTAENFIREHLETTEEEAQAIRTEIPRIILASENFSKELTTCVMWLNDSWLRNAGQEIKCIRLQPHQNGGEILIETSVVIPLPEASAYQTQLGRREQETRVQPSGRPQHTQGHDTFKESIGHAPEKFQPRLKCLYDLASDLERKGIVELSTDIAGKRDYFRLNLLVPGKDQQLVSFNNLLWNGNERGGEITFWPNGDGLAPNSLLRIDELIGEAKSNSGIRYRRLSKISDSDLDNILAAIRDAYLEANGLETIGSVSED